MPRITPLALAGAVVAAASLIAAPAALAGTASVDADGIPRYQAKIGEDNGLFVSEAPHPTNPNIKIVTFRDVVPVTAGAGCSSNPPFEASCNVAIGISRVRAGLEDFADRLAPDGLTTMGFSSEGDSGSDKLIGTDVRDALDGVDGNDTLLGNGGNDALEGATGNDNIQGGDGDDTITGAQGEDIINAGAGADYVDAGIHDDKVTGGTGVDVMFGYYGDDTIDADDNAPLDEINCGPGYDTVIFNSNDKVNSNCEVLVFAG